MSRDGIGELSVEMALYWILCIVHGQFYCRFINFFSLLLSKLGFIDSHFYNPLLLCHFAVKN